MNSSSKSDFSSLVRFRVEGNDRFIPNPDYNWELDRVVPRAEPLFANVNLEENSTQLSTPRGISPDYHIEALKYHRATSPVNVGNFDTPVILQCHCNIRFGG